MKSLSARLSLYTLLIVITLFVLSFSIYFKYTSEAVTEEAFAKSRYQVEDLVSNIDAILSRVEISVENSIYYVEKCLDDPKQYKYILENMLKNNPAIIGASISFEPFYFPEYGEYAMFYTKHDNEGGFKTDLIGDHKNYDYHAMDWYLIPMLKEKNYWSEPYNDTGAGNVGMTTYSAIIRDENSIVIGVITADVALEWMSEMLQRQKPYDNSYSLMLSRNAYYVSHDNKDLILNETFFTATNPYNNEDITRIGKAMIKKEKGYHQFRLNDEDRIAFYAPIESVGWSAAIVSYQDDILAQIATVNRRFWIIVSIALILIFILVILVIRTAIRPLQVFTQTTKEIAEGNFNVVLPPIKSKDELYQLRASFLNMQRSLKDFMLNIEETAKERERIESELTIATQIQMGMLHTIFPPYPDLQEVKLQASLIPAKEVGGDLYDFFETNGILYFTVGDASGKGVPASLLMAVTISLFRSVANHLEDPAEILKIMNNSISESNEANMFITLFVGALNIKTGDLVYSSAGHNAPVLKRDGKAEFIEITPNLPLGIMKGIEFTNHHKNILSTDILFLYSDGLTEAENVEQELYSDERLLETFDKIKDGATVKEVMTAIKKSVADFVLDNEASDDLTMLALILDNNQNTKDMTSELIIKNDIQELNRLAEFIETIGEERGFDPALVMNLNLALEEAVSNIILYAYPEKMGEDISIMCNSLNSSLIFTISDFGAEFDPTKVDEADVTLSAEERGIGGLGIFLIRQIMDEVKYERIENKNVLTIKKNI